LSGIHWFGWISGAALIAFIVFAFRQGMQVKPDGRDISSGADLGSDGSDHGGGGAGHF
jgi:hypothetical protein